MQFQGYTYVFRVDSDLTMDMKIIPYSGKFSWDKIFADAGLPCRMRTQLCLIRRFFFAYVRQTTKSAKISCYTYKNMTQLKVLMNDT